MCLMRVVVVATKNVACSDLLIVFVSETQIPACVEIIKGKFLE